MSKEITQKQIDAWKAEHGEIAKITVGGKTGYVKKPTRQTLGYATTAGAKDPLAFNEIILKQSWLGGDEEILTDIGLFMSVSSQITQLINIQESQLVFI
ncbi:MULTISPECIES: hypothetical protein [Chryseobacterium]|uniref:Uncharacterized protein n=1 Tax=Chryseobacterium koreense CCUG 49689 TaxID=1304281 RepID=A0A0J7IWV4_9FLAO|nr:MULTISPECIES: hypothetical protein [Chryseobacterium]KMQ70311.1 hypothetical protein ACM44_12900 [Chryseobacterium koreense CCUG 49689]MBB5334479.1 hypothetical protein [Chryseobacterium koreense]